MIGLRTLVLTNSYMPFSIFPVSTIPVEDAITRVLNGSCHTVFQYPRKIKTKNHHIYWPSVIASKETFRCDDIHLNHESLYYRDHCICMYCEQPIVSWKHVTMDHVLPKSKGGQDTWNNIVSACGTCNNKKADDMSNKWKPKWKPWTPNRYQLVNIRRKFPIDVDTMDWMEFLGPWTGKINLRHSF